MHELGGRGDFGIGPERPAPVVEVERRHHVGQVDICLPIGVDGADVAPIGHGFAFGADATAGKAVGDGLAMLDDVRDRSEEHTSELQSLMRISYAVFCLKKKKKVSITADE